ncbi:malto-oligosyltrehalose trehalohydrolase [Rhizobium leguminosarum]|uniref:Malto-oligosyltrehalose trehalohydrolase n=1 Tax=Rhizobium leguminosarum TaxID=384 RepID=A0AAJ1EDW3_RHILE|nr:malto-oligosyltrehalose trehalohydrolase [Rhizobium laguerreae]MBY5533474.1 malto-oligosyltrehalose trehalohydrolase [Rhizobium leguminosarum]MBY5595806.1 malto-oligosyltrehalose trehalohydrolase [Rhizobium leguminosarum]MBY5628736.1 malto-oligosyltrehalose trehalohydrolase [Rhizobium leguminosarum]
MTQMTFGPVFTAEGILYRLWAPLHESVSLKLEGAPPRPMQASEDGWHRCTVPEADVGTLYRFVLPDGSEVPDPASRFQPQDAHGPSEVVDLSFYRWKTSDWTGRPWEEMVIYEMHIGCFTPEGTFKAAIERLDHLRALGVTALQIMPLSEFPGRYSWGYDGVLPYAPDSSYGRPEDFMALVDAAHQRGISVFLDVVYNHFGPDGNYIPAYAPLFTDHHKTPWGNGINYDGDGSEVIREFIIENAIYWITEFRLDGFRFDAVHAIKDDSAEHLIHALARRVRAAAANRQVHLIVENEENDSDLLQRDKNGKVKLFTAQWNDDVHHVLHITATGETFGYYADYAGDAGKLGRALAEGFVFQGEHMPYRGASRGRPSAHLPPTAFISFIQNHDQIGNRALGDRVLASSPADVGKAVAAIYLLAPEIPMLFMGEEWGAREPFPFFCDFDEDLNEKVRKGRREELSRLPGFDADDLLDPTAPSTFAAAKLDWSKRTSSEVLEFYRTLLDLRHRRIVPLLKGAGAGNAVYRSAGSALAVDWTLAQNRHLHLHANLGAEAAPLVSQQDDGETIFRLGGSDDGKLAPWTVIWSIGEA